MPRFVKLIVITVVVIILGFGAAGILLSHFVNPNQFKDRLTTVISDKTGYQVMLDGNIGWSFFPNVGFSVETITAKARADSPANFITLKQATISVKLLPLLHKQVHIDAISMDGLNVQLMVDQHGNANWQTNPTAINKKTGALAPSVEVVNQLSSTEPKKTHSDMMVDIAAINVKNASVSYENTSTQQSFQITNMSVTSQHILSGSSFPINIAFDLNSKKPAISSHMDINTNVLIDEQNNIFNFNNFALKSDVTGEALGGKTVPLTLKGDIAVNQSKHITTLSQVVLGFSNMNANTNIEYNLRNDEYKGNLSVPVFDVTAFRASLTKPVDTPQTNASTSVKLAFDGEIMGNEQFVFLNNMQILLNEIPFTGRVGISSFAQNTLDITLNAAQVDLEAFLAGFSQTPRFSGLLNFSTHLTAQHNVEAPLATLNGSGQFEVLNGKLKGENLTQKICDKVALLNKTVSTQSRNADTVFDTLKGSFVITNGVLHSDDITTTMKGATINSQGGSNLVNQTLAFKAGVIITGDSEDVACSVNEHYQNIALPLICEGKYDTEPGKLCHVDEAELANTAKQTAIERASEKLEKKLGSGVNSIMDKLFGK